MMMALETLKGLNEIGGFRVRVAENPLKLDDEFVEIDHQANSIKFKIQNGPIKEIGKNGCQVDTLLHAAYQIIKGLDKNYPCIENGKAMTHILGAINALEARTQDRERRGVEGRNKP